MCIRDRVGGDIFLKKVVKTNELKELEQDVIKADIENLKNELTAVLSRSAMFEELPACQSMIKDLKQSYELKFTALDKKIAELTNTVNQIAKYINQQMLD